MFDQRALSEKKKKNPPTTQSFKFICKVSFQPTGKEEGTQKPSSDNLTLNKRAAGNRNLAMTSG